MGIPINNRIKTQIVICRTLFPVQNHSPVMRLYTVRMTTAVLTALLTHIVRTSIKVAGLLYTKNLLYGTSRCFSGTAKMARIVRRLEFRAQLTLCFVEIFRVRGNIARNTAVI